MSKPQLLSAAISKVFGVAVLRNDASRIYSKYYTRNFPETLTNCKEGDLATVEAQRSFEGNIFEKSRKLVNTKAMKPSDTEIFGYGRFTVLFKILSDVHVFLIADPDENESLLATTLQCITDCLTSLAAKETINNQIITDNFQSLILIIDEIIDQGILVNIDPNVIQSRYAMLDTDDAMLAANPGVGQTASSSSSSSSMASQSAAQQAAINTVGFFKSFFNR